MRPTVAQRLAADKLKTSLMPRRESGLFSCGRVIKTGIDVNGIKVADLPLQT